jgi:hypothetical protein
MLQCRRGQRSLDESKQFVGKEERWNECGIPSIVPTAARLINIFPSQPRHYSQSMPILEIQPYLGQSFLKRVALRASVSRRILLVLLIFILLHPVLPDFTRGFDMSQLSAIEASHLSRSSGLRLVMSVTRSNLDLCPPKERFDAMALATSFDRALLSIPLWDTQMGQPESH